MVFRRRSQRPPPEPGEADIPHQAAFISWSDDFFVLDAAALAQLTPEQRQLQVTARATLWMYADALWDAAKAAGLRPANKPGMYNAIAALRDMGAGLHGAAQEAQSAAGEDDDGPFPMMRLAPLTEWFNPAQE